MARITNVFIDASYVAHRSLTPFCIKLGYNNDGKWIPTGTIFAFFRDLLVLLKRYGTEAKYAIVWDSRPTERIAIDPNYKAHRRRDKSSDMYQNYVLMQRQMAELKVMFPLAGFSQYSCPGYEADDVLATLVDMSKGRTVLVERDKDLYQCLNRGVVLWDFAVEKDYTWFTDEYGIEPAQWTDVQSLAGDPTDNVKGIPGVGIKTAIRLLRSYGDLEGVLESGVIDRSLVKDVRLAQQLVTLNRHLLLDYTPARPNLKRLKRVIRHKRMMKILSQSHVFGKVRPYGS